MRKLAEITLKVISFTLLLLLMALCLLSVSPIYDFEEPRPFSGPDIYNPYAHLDKSNGWKRSVFHTHTKVEGPFNECPFPSAYVDSVYRSFGYEIVCFSNHNELTEHPWSDSLQVDVYEHGFNPLQFHTLVYGSSRVRLFDHFLPLMTSQKQWQYDFLSRDADFLAMNHPDRTRGITTRDMTLLTSYRLMEGDSGVNTEFIHWDEALSAGHYSLGYTNDDLHHPERSRRIIRRCSFLNCPTAGYEDIREALLEGRFYSASIPDFGDGDWDVKRLENLRLPVLNDVRCESDTIWISFSRPAEWIKAIGDGHTTLDSLSLTDSIRFVMRDEDSYVRFTALFPDGVILYTNPFARYDSALSETPYRESVHTVNIFKTVAYNLALLLGLLLCLKGQILLLKRRNRI